MSKDAVKPLPVDIDTVITEEWFHRAHRLASEAAYILTVHGITKASIGVQGGILVLGATLG